MHSFITGHLADARLADIERELAHDAHRAALRVARPAAWSARRHTLAAHVRRLATAFGARGSSADARFVARL